jgi:trans-AT polyketide synthase/acyltransferase/oxidoreductase domain-containing protein
MAGAMYRGVASADLVIAWARPGSLVSSVRAAFRGTKIEANIVRIQAELNADQPYGMNLLANYEYPGHGRGGRGALSEVTA